jgi:hypothetical protein
MKLVFTKPICHINLSDVGILKKRFPQVEVVQWTWQDSILQPSHPRLSGFLSALAGGSLSS